MECPNCNKDIPSELDQFDDVRYVDEYEDRRYLDVEYIVVCPHCGKEIHWFNNWVLSAITLNSYDPHKMRIYKYKENE